jgi:hypothetical protein
MVHQIIFIAIHFTFQSQRQQAQLLRLLDHSNKHSTWQITFPPRQDLVIHFQILSHHVRFNKMDSKSHFSLAQV